MQYEDSPHSSRELQAELSPDDVVAILEQGNRRFCAGEHLERSLLDQVKATAAGQFPLAVVLSCIDSRAPAELIFDLGIGDVFNVRLAGNIADAKALGSMEYACGVAGAKLVAVLGHTRCGAVTASLDLLAAGKSAKEATGCDNIDALVEDIQLSVDPQDPRLREGLEGEAKLAFVDDVARRNVLRTIEGIRANSPTLARLEAEGRIKIVGGLYDVASGEAEFFGDPA